MLPEVDDVNGLAVSDWANGRVGPFQFFDYLLKRHKFELALEEDVLPVELQVVEGYLYLPEVLLLLVRDQVVLSEAPEVGHVFEEELDPVALETLGFPLLDHHLDLVL